MLPIDLELPEVVAICDHLVAFGAALTGAIMDNRSPLKIMPIHNIRFIHYRKSTLIVYKYV